MNRELSREILKLGVPVRIKAIEDELENLHLDFPEFFLSAGPPRILRPESKNGVRPSPDPAHAETERPDSVAWRKKLVHRERTAQWLEKIAAAPRRTVTADTLRDWGMDLRGVSSLVNAGHLTRKGDVFTRSNTTFRLKPKSGEKKSVKKRHVKTTPTVKGKLGAYAKQRALGQQRSFAVLAEIEKHEDGISLADLKRVMPNTQFVGSLGPLARRDYIRHDGKVYKRTPKPYDPGH